MTDIASKCATLVETLMLRAQQHGAKVCLRFLEDGETETETCTFAQLDADARKVAAALRERCDQGDRALLMFPSGIDYIRAFMGCLYAGVIAVPAYPIARNQSDRRVTAILRDCEPKLVLTNAKTAARTEEQAKKDDEVAQALLEIAPRLLLVDQISPKSSALFTPHRPVPSDLAFLQYTSGSIGDPKGVMVTHQNIMANEATIETFVGSNDATVFVSWLPLFHDMGLIGTTLQAIYRGIEIVLFSPNAFLRDPMRWWRAVAHFGGTVTGGPNFAYELSLRRATPETLQGLDLSRLQVAFNGAEPIRASTLKRFSETFAVCGFKPHVFKPCFGMAEATLIISGVGVNDRPTIAAFDKAELAQGRAQLCDAATAEKAADNDAQESVGCGGLNLQSELRIVDPQTREALSDGRVGEIWVAGANVAQGYWNKSDATLRTFQARLKGETSDVAFLRTGDLGFIDAGQLHIAGRLKDLIIIGGRNIYPQDVEESLESIKSLRAGAVIAGAYAGDGQSESIAIVAEVLREVSPEKWPEVVQQITATVFEKFEAAVGAVFLVKQGSIEKTTSGKLRRRATLAAAVEGSGTILHAWRPGTLPPAQQPILKVAGEPAVRPERLVVARKHQPGTLGVAVRRTPAQAPSLRQPPTFDPLLLQQELSQWIARRTQRTQAQVAAMSFPELGLESIDAVELCQLVRDVSGLEIDAQVVYRHPSVEQLVAYCRSELKQSA